MNARLILIFIPCLLCFDKAFGQCTASLNGPSSICVSDINPPPLVFQGANSGTQYQWYKDGNVVGSTFTGNPNPPYNQYTPIAGSSYQVKANGGTCNGFVSNIVVVGVRNPGFISISGSNPNICLGSSVTLTANGGSGYSWSTGQTSTSIVVSPTTSTTYTLYGTESSCGQSVSTNITVNVSPEVGVPSITSGPPSVCQGETTSVYTASATNASSYQWFFSPSNAGSIAGAGATATVTWNAAYVGTATVTARAFSGQYCSIYHDSNPYDVAIKPKPIVYSVSGGGLYCAGAGVSVSLNGAEAGVTYSLFVGSTLIGSDNAAPIRWENVVVNSGQTSQTATVYATKLDCILPMGNTVSITLETNPNPVTAYPITAQNYCGDVPAGVLMLGGSQVGINYQLHKEGVPWGEAVAGTGNGLSWSGLSAGGAYSIVAKNPLSSCMLIMSGPSILRLEPTLFEVQGGGTVCSGSTTTVSLSGSTTGVSYQLRLNGVATGSPVAGTGAAISWTGISSVGIYTVLASSTTLSGCSRLMDKSVKVQSGPQFSLAVSKYPCTYYFAPVVTAYNGCSLTSVSWNFGDGASSTLLEPFHAYAANGSYTVSLQIMSICNGVSCTTTITQPVVVSNYVFESVEFDVTTEKRTGILNTSATTFSDAWPLPYEVASYSNLNPFISGQRGIWRAEGQYAYKAERLQSSPVNLAVDGTYTMDLFNWRSASLDAIPNWIKATTVTKYGAFGFEIEDKDVMDIYSSVLYDYRGQLMTAEGRNMRNDEMAFSSFEDASVGANINTGNWTFGAPEQQTPKPFRVIAGFGHMAIVNASASQLSGVNLVDLSALQFGIPNTTGPLNNLIPNNGIICTSPYGSDAGKTVIVLDEAPFEGSWTGFIYTRPSATGAPAVTSDPVAHTGAYSLKVTGSQSFQQYRLKLDQGKKYFVSAWIAVANPSATAPILDATAGITVKIRKKGTIETQTFPFFPAGPIIEGWQQVQGAFDAPFEENELEIILSAGGKTMAWFDDLRLHPNNGQMKSYVYDIKDYRLAAILDEQNFASLFYYDVEGNLVITKKDTERGRKTISENTTYLKEKGE